MLVDVSVVARPVSCAFRRPILRSVRAPLSIKRIASQRADHTFMLPEQSGRRANRNQVECGMNRDDVVLDDDAGMLDGSTKKSLKDRSHMK